MRNQGTESVSKLHRVTLRETLTPCHPATEPCLQPHVVPDSGLKVSPFLSQSFGDTEERQSKSQGGGYEREMQRFVVGNRKRVQRRSNVRKAIIIIIINNKVAK